MLVDTINKVKNVSIGYVGSDGLFDSATINAYTTSLRGLSETQAKVVLSSTTLDKAQQKQILNKLAETNATVTLTSAEASEALTRKLGSQQSAEELLTKSGLISADELHTGVTITLTESMVKKAIALGKITEEEGKQLLTAFGLTGGNVGLATSFKLLGKQIGYAALEMAKWMVTNPVGQIALFVGILAGAKGIYNLFTTSVKEAQESLEEFNQTCSDLESASNELTSIDDKIKAIQDKGKLSLTDQADLSRLEQERKLLEKEIELLELKKELTEEKSNSDAVKAVNDGTYKNGDGFFSRSIDDLTRAIMQGELDSSSSQEYLRERGKKTINDAKIELAEIQRRNMELLGQITGTDEDSQNAKKQLQEYIDYVNKYLYTAEELQKMKFDGFLSENESIKNAFNDLSKNGADVTSDSIEKLANKFPALKTYMDENGISAETLAAEFAKTSSEAETTGENVNEMTVSLSDLIGVAGGLETLGKAFKEMSDDGHISLDTLSKIKNTFAGSVDDIDSYVDRLMKAKAGSKEFTSALTDLTYGYINQKMSTEQLANADETYIATLLKEVGVSNSVQVAQHMIAVAKEKLRLETEGVSFATADEINELMNEAGASNATKQAIIELAREKVELSAKKIDSSDDIEQLMATAKAAGIAAESYAALARLKASGIADMTSEQRANTRLTPEQTRALEEYEKLKNGEFEFGWENTDLYTYTPKVQYTGGSSNSSSDKNEDLTDAIINRINLRSKELEQQEESIDNALELAEYEKNNEKRYEKQVSLLTEKSTIQKQRLGEIVKANNDIHKVAEELRNSTPDWDEESWFDSQGEATEAYLNLYNNSTKEQQEALSDQFDKLSKLKKAWYENDEDRLALEKDILDTEEEILDLRGEYFNNATDFHSSYFDSRISILEAQYELENSIAEARHELNKELETSKTMYEYLDEETRKLLFNQEDYNELSEELLSIEKRGARLQRQYEKDLQNATLETVEEITTNYERQYETLMKSYEIAKADLEIAKKKQQLNNVLNERKVRMFLNGQWQWVADTEEVARAKSELADAEYAKRVAKAGLKQQESINNLTLQQDQLGIVVKKFENGVITLDEAIIDAAKAIGKLPKALQEMYQNASKGNTSSSSNPFSTGISSPSGASGKTNIVNINTTNGDIYPEGVKSTTRPFSSGDSSSNKVNTIIVYQMLYNTNLYK